jgi:small subunit ribosomal protein S20
MPNTPSAIKRLKQSQKRRMRNRVAKKLIKTYSKRALAAAAEGKFEQAETDYRFAVAKIDRAGIRRILHPNTANRRKSKLSRDYAAAVTKAKAQAQPTA